MMQNNLRDENKIKKKIRPKEMILPVILMVGLVAVAFSIVLFMTQAERVTVDEPLYQYLLTQRNSYPNGISMKANEDSIVINNGSEEYETDGYPFYYENRQALILTDDFLWMNSEGLIQGYIEHFSDVTPLGEGFLHDGSDVYIFMEEAVVTFNKKIVKIPAFSYIVCMQGQTILICPYGSKSILEELSQEGATAELGSGVVINLTDDTYISPNGVRNLLFTKPELFPPVEGGK